MHIIYVDTNKKQDILEDVAHRGGWALEEAGSEARNDREIVREAIKKHPWALQYASPELRKNKELVLLAVNLNGHELRCADPELHADKEIVLAAVKTYGGALEWAAPDLKSDPEVALAAIVEDDRSWRWVGKSLKENRAFLFDVLDHSPFLLKSLDAKWKGDRDLVLTAIRRDPEVIRYASSELQTDAEIVAAAKDSAQKWREQWSR